MSNLETLRTEFDAQWGADKIFYGKSIINNLPDWEDILKILNKSIRDENSKLDLSNDIDYEVVYKDLKATKKLSYSAETYGSSTIESDATFFFSVFFTQDTADDLIPNSIKEQVNSINQILDIKAHFRSLKIALSDKFVPYESHETGHTCIIQLAGTNVWNLRDRASGLQKSYTLEPGDLLLFKEKIEHELTNKDPRSSLVGFFDLGDSHEQ
jgi:hypothetical protein